MRTENIGFWVEAEGKEEVIMKVAVLLYQNMRHAPFLRFYESVFHKVKGIDYDVIYLNRHPELKEEINESYIPISWIGKDDHNLFSKALTAAFYPIKVKKILKKKQYDFIFVLTTMPGVFLADFLRHNYSGKYLFDIRDYTKEYIKVYFNAEKRVVQNSAINVVSSPDYTRFLPKADYYICHNLNLPTNQNGVEKFEKAPGKRIVIAYVGNIQYVEYCMKLIRLVEKDDRFEFHFYGPEGGTLELTDYVNRLQNARISMKGRFKPEEKKKIFESSDIIFNCYGNENDIVRYAISNKYYDAAYYRRPLMVSPNTTMARLTGKYAYPFNFDKENSLDSLYEWYYRIEPAAFDNYCYCVVHQSIEDNSRLEKTITDILEQNCGRIEK